MKVINHESIWSFFWVIWIIRILSVTSYFLLNLCYHSYTFSKNKVCCCRGLQLLCCLCGCISFFRKFAGQIAQLHRCFWYALCFWKLSDCFLFKRRVGLKYDKKVPTKFPKICIVSLNFTLVSMTTTNL